MRTLPCSTTRCSSWSVSSVSAFLLLACGLFGPPQSFGALLVDLDATTLGEGPLATWTNKGSVPGDFASAGPVVPQVKTVDGAKGVAFQGGTTGANGTHYLGPAAPDAVTGRNARTIEAWVHNPSSQDEETIFSWGRRGGPDGSNNSFNHGLNASYGAIGHWGTPDVGWLGQVVTNNWTHVVYTYDSAEQTTVVYADGVEANLELHGAGLNTWGVDNTPAAQPLPFRVGSQTDANGSATTALRGSMSIARIRVHDRALAADAILAKYNEEKIYFANPPVDVTIQRVSYNSAAKTVAIGWTASPGQTFAVEASSNLKDWSSVATGLTTGGFTNQVSAVGPVQFYRVRVQ